ncbi:MAG: hypothetical protein EZS28_041547, partial [Streblomastix strix]
MVDLLGEGNSESDDYDDDEKDLIEIELNDLVKYLDLDDLISFLDLEDFDSFPERDDKLLSFRDLDDLA